MTTENKIVGSITVRAPFEKDWRTYDVKCVFDLHEDGQRSLRAQYGAGGEDFEQEAYALMHAWDTRELQIEVEHLKRDRAPHYCAMDHEPVRHWCDTDPEELSCPVCSARAELEQVKRENAELREAIRWHMAVDGLKGSWCWNAHELSGARDRLFEMVGAYPPAEVMPRIRAALSPQEAAQAAKEGR